MSLLPNQFTNSLSQPLLRGGDIEIAKSKDLPSIKSSNEFTQGEHIISNHISHNTNIKSSANDHENQTTDLTQNLEGNHMHLNERMQINPHGRFGNLQTFLYMILFVAAVLSELGIIYDDYKEHHKNHANSKPQPKPDNLPPFISRIDEIYECAVKLSGTSSVTSIKNGPQWHALQWFIDGAGQFIVAPKASQCSYTSSHEFVQLYGLLVLRESLHLDEPTWGYDEKAPIRSLKDVCQKWHRLSCNEHNTVITKLHLSDMNETKLSGSIPIEITTLHSLEHIELYSNNGLVGTLPHELSRLDSLQYLYMQHTLVHGSIPSTFGSLINLKELFLDDTNLVGSVPSSLCALRTKQEKKINDLARGGSLELFHADCGGDDPRIKCVEPACCTNCYIH